MSRPAPAWTQLALVLDEPPQDGDALLDRLRERGLRHITRCQLTRNRNVMVSFRGPVLRIHEGYLRAPDHVLRAIVEFVQGRTRATRTAARRVLLSFPITAHGRTRRRAPGHPEDDRVAERLRDWHARYNAQLFGGRLRPVAVRVSRRMRARLGHYTPASPAGDPAEIAISRRHLRAHGWQEVLQTLLHEMVHQWQDESGLPLDHGPSFRARASQLGISPYACRRVEAA